MKTETLSSTDRIVRGILAVISQLFFICVVIQVFLAGIATFVNYGDWELHTTFIHYFEFTPIIMLILSFFVRVPNKLRWDYASLYLLIIMQYVTTQLTGSAPFVTAIHPVIALVLFWRSLVTVKSTMKMMQLK
ncbi:hypothetical protein SAMN05216232_0512 [Virgibacillus subterraneus]|uniref:Uncharacterized protein n=1 Tax=Virgibacillus subterraneus TaxID=621109 RepID=A0A1H8ZPM2_9BACI|nr:DUF6220 domain-containing protein [Virgibacillus subterraneus]SEP66390.1 hypothetical protein SAMN05216232_0512 [Virgibacillus subterraneus]